MARISIVGGGVIGLSAAVALARSGHQVAVIDDDTARDAASWGNAGHIAIEQVVPLASPASLRSAWRRRFGAGGALDMPIGMASTWLPFAARFVAASTPPRFRAGTAALTALLAQAMPAWARLSAAIGAPELLKQDGHIVAWETAHSAEAGRAAWRSAEIGTTTISDVDANDLTRIAAISATQFAGAIRFGGSGQIADLERLDQALQTALRERGGRVVRQKAEIVFDGAHANVSGLDADLVIVAAGARSGALLAPIGIRAPLIAERGYHIRAAAGHWPAEMPPIVFEDRSMIVTRYANCVQAASFVEFSRIDAPPDPRKWERLESHVRALGLAMHPPFERWIGARPTLPDYLPAIGRSRLAPNLIYAFGHQHLGLTLAAITAEQIAALVDNAAPALDLAAFDLSRFGGIA